MKLIARIPTELGPRTTVTQALSPAEAHALADVVEAAGGAVYLSEDGPRVHMAKRMHRMRQAKERAALRADERARAQSGNVATFPTSKAALAGNSGRDRAVFPRLRLGG